MFVFEVLVGDWNYSTAMLADAIFVKRNDRLVDGVGRAKSPHLSLMSKPLIYEVLKLQKSDSKKTRQHYFLYSLQLSLVRRSAQPQGTSNHHQPI